MTADDVFGWMARVPPGVWVGLTVANVLLAAGTLAAARRCVRRAGQRFSDPAAAVAWRGKDTLLTVASIVPAGLFWLMVLAGSFHGLVAFGRSTLGWEGGWEYLVPGTLDGVSVTFAMLAFRAVRRQKSPDRCYRVVWGAALASATINFSYEYETSGNALAGGYVGLLSLFGMVMFDEFLSQFEDGAQRVHRENPKFGLRWLTWPTNTFLAFVAWRNHPPAEGTPGTVANAVANLEQVRAQKRARRARGRSGAISMTPMVVSTEPPVSKPQPATAGGSAGGLDAVVVPTPAAKGRSVARRSPTGRGGRTRESEIPVPATAGKVQAWAQTWIVMCERPELMDAALRNDDVARQQFGCTARQLRHIKFAVSTGALRRRAAELSVELPAGFDESASQGGT